ncbi:MAG: hypothetical protein IJL52_09035 [Clostridia bacterium]|nr:hypothetical protein [Clostridia bacterium]
MKEFKEGVTAPPFHPWCRCTTVPYFDDMKDIGERWMRDPETGKTGVVPEDMTYQEWKEVFVDKPKESDIIKADGFDIGRSIGARALNYDIYDPYSGEYFTFAEGTRIQDVQIFAGKGARKPLNEGVPEGLTKEFGGKIEDWQHAKGIGVVDYNGEELKAEVHWFQEKTVGRVKFKVKEWLE